MYKIFKKAHRKTKNIINYGNPILRKFYGVLQRSGIEFLWLHSTRFKIVVHYGIQFYSNW